MAGTVSAIHLLGNALTLSWNVENSTANFHRPRSQKLCVNYVRMGQVCRGAANTLNRISVCVTY